MASNLYSEFFHIQWSSQIIEILTLQMEILSMPFIASIRILLLKVETPLVGLNLNFFPLHKIQNL